MTDNTLAHFDDAVASELGDNPITAMPAEEFLSKFHEGGSVNLVAFTVEEGRMTAGRFQWDDLSGMREWIARHITTHNIYHHVNECRELKYPDGKPKLKASKSDITQVNWLHVDIDPRTGEDLNKEQLRIRKQIDVLSEEYLTPNIVVFSGGGFQAYWKLKEPIIINDLKDITRAENYNGFVRQLYVGADACHNIDRIMRVPGTWNLPNKKKTLKGRIKSFARPIIFDLSFQYLESELETVRETVTKNDTANPQIAHTGATVEDISELDQWYVEDRIKYIIIHGTEEGDSKKLDQSRSAYVFDVVCHLVRKNVPDDIIYAILTNPAFKISESILEKRSRAAKTALRQIKRAHEHAIHPKLAEYNSKYAIVKSVGSRAKIMTEYYDPIFKRNTYLLQSKEDWQLANGTDKVAIGENRASATAWWLAHPQRREFDGIVFDPKDSHNNYYNTWKGFAYEPIPGDCSLYLEHIRDNVCSGNLVHYDYVLKWMAHCVQHPDIQGHVAIILQGEQGTGKSFFANNFGKLFGEHFIQIAQQDHLVGNFNGLLSGRVVVFADEAFYAGDKRHANVLKALITEDSITVERKFFEAEAQRNYIHLIMASNNNWVVSATVDARRFFVLRVSSARKRDNIFFKEAKEQLENGGYSALLHMLLNMDLSDFDVRTFPDSDALQDQIQRGLTEGEIWWKEKLDTGELLDYLEPWRQEVNIPVSDLKEDYAKAVRQNYARINFDLVLQELPVTYTKEFKVAKRVKRLPGGQPFLDEAKTLCYCFPSLEVARESWKAKFTADTFVDIPD